MAFSTQDFESNSMLPLEPLKKYLDEHGSLKLSISMSSESFPDMVNYTNAEDVRILTMLLFVALAENRQFYSLLKGAILSYESTVMANKPARDSIIGKTVIETRLETEKIFIETLAKTGDSSPLIAAMLKLYNIEKNISPDQEEKFVPIKFSAS